MTRAYFVTGTDTGVGKTFIASALVHQFAEQGLKSIGMKPVAAGCVLVGEKLTSEDVSSLIAAGNVTAPLTQINPYAFAPAIAPHIAAKKAGVEIKLEVILKAYQALAEKADAVIVEGAGGFNVPLGDRINGGDLAVALNIPIILVIGMRLGCLNHALLTVEAIKARGLTLAGWVANQIDPHMEAFDENLDALRERILAPCIATTPWGAHPDLNAIGL